MRFISEVLARAATLTFLLGAALLSIAFILAAGCTVFAVINGASLETAVMVGFDALFKCVIAAVVLLVISAGLRGITEASER